MLILKQKWWRDSDIESSNYISFICTEDVWIFNVYIVVFYHINETVIVLV